MHKSVRSLLLATAAPLALLPGIASAAPAGSTVLIDRPAGEAALPFDGLRYSILQSRQSLSADGNRIVFESEADALHAGEGDRHDRYVYVRDRAANTTTNLCRSTGGVIGNEGCNEASISPNGRYVIFRSSSTNLVAGASGPLNLIFRRDLQTGATELVSRETGAGGAAVSSGYIGGGTSVADNGIVVFSTTASLSAIDTAAHSDVYARVGTETRLLSRTSGGVIGNATSEAPVVSGDGSTVAFESDATNVGGTDANGARDVYLAPIGGSSTPSIGSRMSSSNMTGNGESREAALSQTGQFLAFSTDATDLFSEPITTDANGATDVIRRDRISSTNTVVSLGAGNAQATGRGVYGPSMSADGSKVAFGGSMPRLRRG